MCVSRFTASKHFDITSISREIRSLGISTHQTEEGTKARRGEAPLPWPRAASGAKFTGRGWPGVELCVIATKTPEGRLLVGVFTLPTMGVPDPDSRTHGSYEMRPGRLPPPSSSLWPGSWDGVSFQRTESQPRKRDRKTRVRS